MTSTYGRVAEIAEKYQPTKPIDKDSHPELENAAVDVLNSFSKSSQTQEGWEKEERENEETRIERQKWYADNNRKIDIARSYWIGAHVMLVSWVDENIIDSSIDDQKPKQDTRVAERVALGTVIIGAWLSTTRREADVYII